MFTYFHDHKNKYNKGQLTPVYILILVIVIIMAMVTVNLSKVAMMKTDASNAADAGALATGAIMANVFNSVAVQNSLMMQSYWTAFATLAAMFSFAFINLTLAYMAASDALIAGTSAEALAVCPTSCAAAAAARAAAALAISAAETLENVSTTITAIGLYITATSILQHYAFYLPIRRMALKGRTSSIRNGHGFVFSNSGIGSKLIAGSPPDDVADPAKKNGYRDLYVDFLDGIGDNEYYQYAWKDGRKDAPDRSHTVDSNVHVDSIDEFELTVAIAPTPLQTVLLGSSKLLVDSAAVELAEAAGVYEFAADSLAAACSQLACCNPSPPGVVCCSNCAELAAQAQLALPEGIAGNSAAIFSMTGTFVLLIASLAGLFPSPIPFPSSSETDSLAFLECWIHDINYDNDEGLIVRIDTKQTHQGADLGLWKTDYPDTSSYSKVNFEGRGSIDPPNPRYGSDIVEVDNN